MRNLEQLNSYRVLDPRQEDGWLGDETCGAFIIPSSIDGKALRIIASSGEGWDHVSVSLADRCPTWAEMEQVAKAFFKPGEVAMQLHVPASDHINIHDFCLHWWRPHRKPIPLPPKIFV